MNAAALAAPISLPLKFQAEHFGHRPTDVFRMYMTENLFPSLGHK